MTRPQPSYLFDNAAEQARERFAGLAGLYDAVTFRHLDALGIDAGWRCLEVGAGGGSVASFMCERVGPAGHVLATDVHTGWLPAEPPANLEVRRHDIGADPLPEAAFDLVHARAVLIFVPDRQAAVGRMVASLRPGGWLLLEELDALRGEAFRFPDSPDAELLQRIGDATFELMRRRGADLGFARRLPRVVGATGLTDLGAEGYFVPIRTAAVARLAIANLDQVRDELIETGFATAAELDRCRAVLQRPGCLFPASLPLISVWGRRPC
jgi:SAM-dependent methyltransferase